MSAYSETYGYDANGNRTARTTVLGATTTNCTYVPDADNRITSETQEVVGGATTTVQYGYGSVGNPNILTRQVGTGSPPPQLETYSYDHAERLITYVKQVSGATNANYSYRYLPTGERLSKVNVPGGSNNEEWYYPDGPDVTADYTRTTGSGTYTLASTYVNGPGIDSKLARIAAGGTELYYLGDGLGSVQRVINGSQAVQNTTLTTAWGLPHPGFTPVVGQPDRYGFTQRENDAESGLMQFRARAYDPRLGRFTQTDPILGNRPIEHYAYAGNNPVSFSDPNGTDKVRREFLQRLLDANKLQGEQRKYAQWYIHSDEKFESLSGMDGPDLARRGYVSDEALQYLKNAQFNWKWLEKEGVTKGFQETESGAEVLGEEAKALERSDWSESISSYNRWSRLSPDAYDLTDASVTLAMMAVPGPGRPPLGRGRVRSGGGRLQVRNWKFDINKDLDWRGSGKSFKEALDEGFRRTGVDRSEFEVTKWAKDKYGKSHPVEWRVKSGANKGAEVNVDIAGMEGPDAPHVGFQTPGKRSTGGGERGHILLDEVPYNR